MAKIHTVSQCFIVKENYEEIIEQLHSSPIDVTLAWFTFEKLLRVGSSVEVDQYTNILISGSMIVAVEE